MTLSVTQQTIDTTNNDTLDTTLNKIKTNLAALAAASIANSGTFVANSGTGVAVVDAGVTASSIIIYTLKTVGGTVAAPFTATITPGTGFHANSGASDTSTYNWVRIG